MTRIQSILFDNKMWTIPEAINYLQSNGFRYYKVDVTKNKLRFRQYNPDNKNEYYRIHKFTGGVEAVVGFKKNMRRNRLSL